MATMPATVGFFPSRVSLASSFAFGTGANAGKTGTIGTKCEGRETAPALAFVVVVAVGDGGE